MNPIFAISIPLKDVAEQIAMALVNKECTIEEVINFIEDLDICIAELEFTDKAYKYFKKEYEELQQRN